MKRIVLYVDPVRENARAIARRVSDRFTDAGYDVVRCDAGEDSRFSHDGRAVEGARLLVTIGGDGTLLRAARLAITADIPLIGINTGRLGFLTEFDEDDPRIDDLPAFLERGLVVEERLALRASYGEQHFFALNDVVVRKGSVSRLVPFTLCLDEDQAAHIPADGICVATPTGSTAYFLSAGGSIVSPQVDAIGVVPLLPHTLFSRPIIVSADSRISVGCDSELVQANLECDGEVVTGLAPGSSVVIARHPCTVKFARIERLKFFERLERKMQWGVSIKEKLR